MQTLTDTETYRLTQIQTDRHTDIQTLELPTHKKKTYNLFVTTWTSTKHSLYTMGLLRLVGSLKL